MLGNKEKIHFHQLPTWGGNSFEIAGVMAENQSAPRQGRLRFTTPACGR